MATRDQLIAAVENLKTQNAVNKVRITSLKARLQEATAQSTIDDTLIGDINAVSNDLKDGGENLPQAA